LKTIRLYYVCSLHARHAVTEKRILPSTLIYLELIYLGVCHRARYRVPKNENQKGKSLNLFRDLIDANVQSALPRVLLIALITQCDSIWWNMCNL